MLRLTIPRFLFAICLVVASIVLINISRSNTYIPTRSQTQVLQSSPTKRHEIVIYNRIPKTGGTSIINRFEVLKNQNQFLVMRVNVTNALQFHSVKMHQLLVEKMTSSTLPVFLHGHFSYIDFRRFGSNVSPFYINVLREPLERLISKYYFIRFGDNHRPRTQRSRMINNTERWQSFDECVAMRGRDCRSALLWSQVPFLCGSAWYCSIAGDKMALRTAKRRLVEDYLLVGVTENITEFMFVLKFLLPSFLSESSNNDVLHLRKTNRKLPISSTTREYFHKDPIWLAEHELYEFGKNEFSSRYHAFLKSPVRKELSSNLILST